jgi:multicomponent Na+:H+ antiporter subunit B
MRSRSSSPIIQYGARLISPYIMVFGLYVITHGHYSPGGGFQGGALLAAAVLLVRLAAGQRIAQNQLSEILTMPFSILGIALYFGIGLVAVIMGGYFLDYGKLPIPGLDPIQLRFYGVLIIELGIGLAVMAVLVLIYDNMTKGED